MSSRLVVLHLGLGGSDLAGHCALAMLRAGYGYEMSMNTLAIQLSSI